MNIYFDGENIPQQAMLDKMNEAAMAALELEQVTNDEIEISLTFVSGEEIQEINRDYRDVDAVTDVLSFPQFSGPEEIPEEGCVLLGDVVICTDRALSQAEEFGHSAQREIVYLFTHSMFHLLGYDHMEEEEKTLMRAREEEVMNRIGVIR